MYVRACEFVREGHESRRATYRRFMCVRIQVEVFRNTLEPLGAGGSCENSQSAFRESNHTTADIFYRSTRLLPLPFRNIFISLLSYRV